MKLSGFPVALALLVLLRADASRRKDHAVHNTQLAGPDVGNVSATLKRMEQSLMNAGSDMASGTKDFVSDETNEQHLAKNKVKFGDRFIQIGDWRFGDVDGGHASIAHKGGKTAIIFRMDGTIHKGPRNDYTTWSRPTGKAKGIKFGHNFIQIGQWRLGDVDGAHSSIAHKGSKAHKGGKTALIFRIDGTIHPGPRKDWTTWPRKTGKAKGIAFGYKFIQIGQWRLGDVDGNHASIAHKGGKTAIIFRGDGTIHQGPRNDFTTWSRPTVVVKKLSANNMIKAMQLMLKRTTLPKIIAEHRAAQRLADRVYRQFAKCSSMRKAATGRVLSSMLRTRRSIGASFKKCRKTQAARAVRARACTQVLVADNRAKAAACSALRVVQKDPNKEARVCKSAGGRESYGAWITRISRWSTKKANQYKRYKVACDKATRKAKARTKRCAPFTRSIIRTKATCDARQDQLEQSTCSILTHTQAACSKYLPCFAQAKATANKELRDIKRLTVIRRMQWEDAEKLACLLGHGCKATAQQIKACAKRAAKKAQNFFRIRFRRTPRVPTRCPVPVPATCSSRYVAAFYSGLPRNARAKTCKACVGLDAALPLPANFKVRCAHDPAWSYVLDYSDVRSKDDLPSSRALIARGFSNSNAFYIGNQRLNKLDIAKAEMCALSSKTRTKAGACQWSCKRLAGSYWGKGQNRHGGYLNTKVKKIIAGLSGQMDRGNILVNINPEIARFQENMRGIAWNCHRHANLYQWGVGWHKGGWGISLRADHRAGTYEVGWHSDHCRYRGRLDVDTFQIRVQLKPKRLVAKGCRKWRTTGWHSGDYKATLEANQAPNGVKWTWQQCASECAAASYCEFWTLQLTGTRRCLLLANKRRYHNTGNHVEGPRDAACLKVAKRAQTYQYVGCFEGNRMRRPFGDKPSTIAGVQSCRDACAKGGYEFFGAECPHANGREFHCECGSGAGAVAGKSLPSRKCAQFNKRSGAHCSGPFEVSGAIGTYRLGAGSIGSVYRTAPTVGKNDFKYNKPWYWLRASHFNRRTNTWGNLGTKGNIGSVVRGGALTMRTERGHGASRPVISVRGNAGTKLYFGNIVPGSDFTFCALTRYTGGRHRGRILLGGGNWLFGHWARRAGVVHTQHWVTGHSDRKGTKWVAMCARSQDFRRKESVVLDGRPVGNGRRVQRPRNEVGVNFGRGASCCTGEKSDFAIAEIIVWPGDSLKMGVEYFKEVLGTLSRKATPLIALQPLQVPKTYFGKKPLYWLRANNFNRKTNTWMNFGTKGNIKSVVRGGTLTTETYSGYGAVRPIISVQGNANTKLYFGNLVPGSDFTFCALTRYTGGRHKGRILLGGGNWLFGHWARRAGVAHPQTHWVTSTEDRKGINWVALCARSQKHGRTDSVLLDGIPIGNRHKLLRPKNEVGVNFGRGKSCCTNEKSDFAIAEILVWPGDAVKMGAAYLKKVMER